MDREGHRRLIATLGDIIGAQEWARLDEVFTADAVQEYPQSGERFRGIDNIRAQFANYPELLRQAPEIADVVGGTTYAMTPLYTVIAVDGSGDRGVGILRSRYPDGSYWWVVNVYELDGERIARTRAFFAPEFEPPQWRAPFWDRD